MSSSDITLAYKEALMAAKKALQSKLPRRRHVTRSRKALAKQILATGLGTLLIGAIVPPSGNKTWLAGLLTFGVLNIGVEAVRFGVYRRHDPSPAQIEATQRDLVAYRHSARNYRACVSAIKKRMACEAPNV